MEPLYAVSLVRALSCSLQLSSFSAEHRNTGTVVTRLPNLRAMVSPQLRAVGLIQVGRASYRSVVLMPYLLVMPLALQGQESPCC